MSEPKRQFIYFCEARDTVPVDMAGCVGLGHVFDAAHQPAVGQSTAGPGGPGGCVLGDPSAAAGLGFYPEAQTWERLPGHAGTWIGRWNDRPLPTPEDLQRADGVPGYWTELEGPDGRRRWLVPTLRVHPSGTNLPQSIRMNSDGTLTTVVLPRYAEICRQAVRLWDITRSVNGLLGPGEAAVEPMSDAEEFLFAAAVLGVNYRVGPGELSMLGCLTTDNLKRVLYLAVDLPGFFLLRSNEAEAAKKSGASLPPPGWPRVAGGTTSSGGEA